MVVKDTNIVNKIAQVQIGVNNQPLENVKIIKSSII